MQIRRNAVVQGVKRTAAEVDALLGAGTDRLAGARDALAARIDHTGDRLRDIEVGAARKVRVAARQAERYARGHPWQVAGIGLALAAAVGIAIWLAARS